MPERIERPPPMMPASIPITQGGRLATTYNN